jgi:uncharacterized NAD(P)/FAD-binding protein YdhS
MTATIHQDNISDITFIGSGISTSFTIIPLLKLVSENTSKSVNLKLTIIEKSDEFHTGLAYGNRSGASALLITSLADFLPKGDERDAFINWLSNNKTQLIQNLLDDGGMLSQNWVKVHHQDIANNKWEHLYIPRRFFGIYIKEKVQQAIDDFNKNNSLELHYVTDEVIDIERNDSNYTLHLKGKKESVISEKVVISVGIPPVKQFWSDSDAIELSDEVCFITDPYKPSLSENLKKIQSFVNQKSNASNILILGANASAMEMIYKTNDIENIKSKINNVFVVSPQGELPNSAPDESYDEIEFVPKHLLELQNFSQLKAIDIYNAANKDLDIAAELGYGTAITEIPVSKGFLSLLNKLDTHELKEFACHYGNEIGKRQRRAGRHYTNVVDTLKSQNQLHHIKGHFSGVAKSNQKTGVHFNYKKNKNGIIETSNDVVQIIINCVGSKTLNQSPISPLIDNLIKKEYSKPNDSMRGFLINEHFESTPNLYIMGPLLAGNLINSTPLWHIEHCGRIISLGKLLAKELSKTI